MAKSTASRATTFILRELVGELLYFPVWWYSRGLVLTSRALTRRWMRLLNQLSIPILLRNMGKPMYGDYTRSGRVISFFFRIFLVVTKCVWLGVWTVIELIALAAWVAGPVVAVAMLAMQAVPQP